jgi:hypothetical protein
MKPDEMELGRDADPGDAEMESLIRALPLASPSQELDLRIARTLKASRRRWRLAPLAGLAASVALAAAIGWKILPRSSSNPPTPITPAPLPITPASFARPLRIEQNQVRLTDRGIVGFAGATPLRGFHVHGMKQIWYVDPAGKRVCVTVPTDRVVLVPVQTF